MRMTTTYLRKTIRRAILESYKDPNECIREAEQALLRFDDWETPEQDILEWWIHEGADLIQWLPEVNWQNLPGPSVRALDIVMQEFRME